MEVVLGKDGCHLLWQMKKEVLKLQRLEKENTRWTLFDWKSFLMKRGMKPTRGQQVGHQPVQVKCGTGIFTAGETSCSGESRAAHPPRCVPTQPFPRHSRVRHGVPVTRVCVQLRVCLPSLRQASRCSLVGSRCQPLSWHRFGPVVHTCTLWNAETASKPSC